MTTLHTIEWLAALLTIAGAWLLASNTRRAAWGWVLFLAANGLWIAFALLQGYTGLLVQQLVLTATSLLGIWKGLIAPRLEGGVEQLIEETKS